MKYRFMKENRDRYSITKMAAVFGTSRSAYYRWVQQGCAGKREQAERELVELLRKICIDIHRRRYGAPRVRMELLKRYGLRVSRKRIAALMRKYGLNARSRRKFIRTTDSRHRLPVCENWLNREFDSDGPGQKWVSDITYLRTTGGWIYLTVVMDLFDRNIIGWALSNTMDTEQTVVKAFTMAFRNRQAGPGLTVHSDRGVQYCSAVFRQLLAAECPGVRQSMSRKGNCWDNACAESFFKTLKRELETVNGRHSPAEVTVTVFEYIEGYYNRNRLHSSLDFSTPNDILLKTVA